jgi:hypothetical protein
LRDATRQRRGGSKKEAALRKELVRRGLVVHDDNGQQIDENRIVVVDCGDGGLSN